MPTNGRMNGWMRRDYTQPTKPLYQGRHVLGSNGKNFTALTLKVLPSTQEFPEPALTFQASNPAGSAFAKLSGLEELIDLANWLNTQIATLQPVWKKAMEDKVSESDELRQYNDLLAKHNGNVAQALNEMMALNADNHGG